MGIGGSYIEGLGDSFVFSYTKNASYSCKDKTHEIYDNVTSV